MSVSSTELVTIPFWWKAAEPENKKSELPEGRVDILIIGAGYTGLSAARTLLKKGQSVVVIDAERPAFGASSRNGGMVGNLLKPGLSGLIAEYGEVKGVAVAREAVNSVVFTRQLIDDEGIDCDFKLNGRSYPAVTQKHLVSMAKESELRVKYLSAEEEILGKGAYQEDVHTSLYSGAIRQQGTGGLHPAKYARGLVDVVEKAGGVVIAPCRADQVCKTMQGFETQTSNGVLKSRQVLFATNGYSGPLNPFLQRRVMPIGSTMIATEALDPEFVRALFPTSRMITDSRKMLSYYRPSPDGRHILLGGRPGIFPASAEKQALSLHSRLAEIFPELGKVAVQHVWSGNVAYGFEALPTVGQQGGAFYALGYCGSGVAMSGYLGHKAALQMLEEEEGQTAFDDLPFTDRPYYHGKPWFVPVAMIGYTLRDRFGI